MLLTKVNYEKLLKRLIELFGGFKPTRPTGKPEISQVTSKKPEVTSSTVRSVTEHSRKTAQQTKQNVDNLNAEWTSLSGKPALETSSNKTEKLVEDCGEDCLGLASSSACFLSESCFVCFLFLFFYLISQ